MKEIRTIIGKEWTDMVHNKLVLYMLILLPLLMTALPVALLYFIGRVPVNQQDLEEMGRLLANPIFSRMSPAEAMQSSMANTMLILFLLMPLAVPVTIAAYSIVGEKVERSLEPLLATPITTTQLLLGKSIAAAAPAIVITWFCYVVFLIFARFFAVSDRVFNTFVNPMWLIAMLLLVPLLTVLAVSVGIIISSRSTDPRAAEQLGALVVFPLIAFLLGTMAGFILLNVTTFLLTSAIVALLDAGLVYVGVALFQRETILTRWK